LEKLIFFVIFKIKSEKYMEKGLYRMDLIPHNVPTFIRELPVFFILQSDRPNAAEPGGF
jgi:hypothetical protein